MTRFDVDAEVAKVDESTPVVKPVVAPVVPPVAKTVDATGLSEKERKTRAEAEKQKGNEVTLFSLSRCSYSNSLYLYLFEKE